MIWSWRGGIPHPPPSVSFPFLPQSAITRLVNRGLGMLAGDRRRGVEILRDRRFPIYPVASKEDIHT